MASFSLQFYSQRQDSLSSMHGPFCRTELPEHFARFAAQSEGPGMAPQNLEKRGTFLHLMVSHLPFYNQPDCQMNGRWTPFATQVGLPLSSSKGKCQQHLGEMNSRGPNASCGARASFCPSCARGGHRCTPPMLSYLCKGRSKASDYNRAIAASNPHHDQGKKHLDTCMVFGKPHAPWRRSPSRFPNGPCCPLVPELTTQLMRSA